MLRRTKAANIFLFSSVAYYIPCMVHSFGTAAFSYRPLSLQPAAALRRPLIRDSKQIYSAANGMHGIRNLRTPIQMTASKNAKETMAPEIKIVALPTNEGSEKLLKIRHSSAHIMAMAVQRLYKDAQVTIGPWIENGFFYDFDLKGKTFEDSDLKSIRKEMIKIINKNYPIKREVVSREDALSRIQKQNEPYKIELLEAIPKGEDISIYHIGDEWWDLCAGPHVESTGEVPASAFELTKVSGAYWRGDEKNAMLQRVYGTAWETPEQLVYHKHLIAEALRRDHRKLGQELDLFSIQEDAGGGLVFWHPKGGRMRHQIESFWKELHLARGYELVYSPHIANVELWKTSGHYDFYAESMFDQIKVEDESYQLKPMNCPFHVLMFQNSPRSYKSLPLRWAELGTVYRYERSGTLSGLFRVRGFTQDDAHVFCRPEQVADEIGRILDLTEEVLQKFGFNKYQINLSTRPAASIGGDDIWKLATDALVEALGRKGWDYVTDEGGGAFYGPKIDIKIQDALGRYWQCSTVQCDFNLPERFDLNFIAPDGTKQRPIMIHRAIFGSIERFFGILVENYAGDFPLWLSPEQLRLLPISDTQAPFCQQVAEELRAAGVRVTVDDSANSLGKKIRNAEVEKVPLTGVVGNAEMTEGSVALRVRKEGEMGSLSLAELKSRVLQAIALNVPFVDTKPSAL